MPPGPGARQGPSLDPTKKKDGTRQLARGRHGQEVRPLPGAGGQEQGRPPEGRPGSPRATTGGARRQGLRVPDETRDKTGPREAARASLQPARLVHGGLGFGEGPRPSASHRRRATGLRRPGLTGAHARHAPRARPWPARGARRGPSFRRPTGGARRPGAGSNPYLSALDLAPAPQVKSFFSPEPPDPTRSACRTFRAASPRWARPPEGPPTARGPLFPISRCRRTTTSISSR